MTVNIVCDTDGLAKGAYLFSKREHEQFMNWETRKYESSSGT